MTAQEFTDVKGKNKVEKKIKEGAENMQKVFSHLADIHLKDVPCKIITNEELGVYKPDNTSQHGKTEGAKWLWEQQVSLEKILDFPKDDPVVYAITAEKNAPLQEALEELKDMPEEDTEGKTPKKLKQNWSDGKNYNISLINGEHFGTFEWHKNSICLYIGSSNDDICKRLRQHLGITGNKRRSKKKECSDDPQFGFSLSRSTYSLWLNDWWERKYGKITILVWNFTEILRAAGEELKQEKLPFKIRIYHIEDIFWQAYKPWFGKAGKGPNA
jgi:hypothetical protein